MEKPRLKEPFNILEGEIIETLVAGLHQWRSDLNYPQSYSDYQACVRGLLVMFDIRRRPLARDLPVDESGS